MYCKNCGAQIDDKAVVCVHCGHQMTPPTKTVSSAVTILLLIFFFPVGLYLMWAKTNWSKVAKVIITIAIAIVTVIVLAQTEVDSDQNIGGTTPAYSNTQNTGNIDSTETPNTATEVVDPYKDAIVITPADLFAAYDSNEVAADNKYKGKMLKITGTIKDIGKDILDDAYITLDCGELIVSVQCYFKSNQLDAVAELAKDQTITIVGTCRGQSMNVLIKDCVILN